MSTSTDDGALRERLNLEASQYEGPVGIVGVLAEVAMLAGIPAVAAGFGGIATTAAPAAAGRPTVARGSRRWSGR